MPICDHCLCLKAEGGLIEGATVLDCIILANNTLERKDRNDIFAWNMIRAAASAASCPMCKNHLRKLRKKLLAL
jgi:hypothetical protein